MEALCWCKPEFEATFRAIYGCAPNILLVHGFDKVLSCKFDTCTLSELNLDMMEQHDVITTVEPFFSTEDEYYDALGKLVHVLWKERQVFKKGDIFFCLVREASNWIHSKNKVIKDDRGSEAEFIKSVRECRHHAISIAVDSLRFVNVLKELRDISDYTWIKQVGGQGLPKDLHWLYGLITPFSFTRMAVDTFILNTAKGSVGYGYCDSVSWHKKEGEDILKNCKIEIHDADVDKKIPIDEKPYEVGSFEHYQVIKNYLETKSMPKTAEILDRSYKTVNNHITEHNKEIDETQECSKCRTAKAPFSKIRIFIPKAGRPKVEKTYQEMNNNHD